MTDLSRDARSLVARVRRRDGPTSADRERVRSRLEEAWYGASADLDAQWVTVAPSTTTALRLQPPLVAALCLSIGFLTPESPHAAERPEAPVVAPAEAAPASTAPLAEVALQPLAASPLEDNAAPRPTLRSVRGPWGRVRGRPAPRRAADQPPKPEAPPPRVRVPAAEAAPLVAATAPEPAAEHAEPLAMRARSVTPARSTEVDDSRVSSAESGDVAPVLRRDSFTPQPIAEELAWVGAAQNALRDRQPSRALRLVQEHAFRFPRGALAPERIAVQALSLCALQRKGAARQVLANLVARSPGSPLIDRVRRECGFP